MNTAKQAFFSAVGRELHIDTYLSNMALDYRPAEMIADMIFPVVNVGNQSNYYPEFLREDVLRVVDTIRSPGTEAKRITRSVGSGTYFCDNYALKTSVTVEDKANSDPIILQKLYNGRTQFLLDKLFLDWEVRVANQVTSGSNVGSYAAVNSAWSDTVNANPLTNIWQAIDNVQDSTGKRPNRIIFGEQAWREFRRNQNVLNILFGNNNGGGYASREQVKNLFEMEFMAVGGAYKNEANEAQAENLSKVWGENVLVYYAPMNPSMDEPSFGYSFRWTVPEVPALQVERHPYNTKTKSEEIESGYYQDEKITGAAYGFLLTT